MDDKSILSIPVILVRRPVATQQHDNEQKEDKLLRYKPRTERSPRLESCHSCRVHRENISGRLREPISWSRDGTLSLVSPMTCSISLPLVSSSDVTLGDEIRSNVAARLRGAVRDAAIISPGGGISSLPPRLSYIVFDSTALLQTSVSVVRDLLTQYVVCIPHCVVAELDELNSFNNRYIRKDQKYLNARKLRDLMRQNEDKMHFRVQRVKEVHVTDDLHADGDTDTRCIEYALYLQKTNRRPVVLLSQAKKVRDLGAQAQLTVCSLRELWIMLVTSFPQWTMSNNGILQKHSRY
ncbi:PIN domain [Trypanosoma vivax]|uniref:PIN domain-containing protein n=1 Tax=Trypanosoma vivax (strain Y486) TaxID=1055687 RepID=G0UAM9_TRYVY|nr:hypothetical protein TRVL_03220 [Trypanosoma vivax]KAH8611725.1 PIN domain [Trypanosoma vivax]CCC52864.1 conserved hypothetical protein [Trypanosoma vivax Y486]